MRLIPSALVRVLLLPVLFAACAPATVARAPSTDTQLGPRNGYLVIAGGGRLEGTGIVERFLELAGGPDAPIVVIPTAAGDSVYGEDWPGLEVLWAAGATNVSVLHAETAELADSESFVRPLRDAAGVWIPGGRQWRLTDAYLDTRTQIELEALLDRGGVVGGSSAGASIQASFLVRGGPEGNQFVISPGNERGFGLLRQAAIDQHLFARGRERDLLEVLHLYPDLLGIGIDESTAIVVSRDAFEVIGDSQVAVYDGSDSTARTGYHVLHPGARYDMRNRAVIGD